MSSAARDPVSRLRQSLNPLRTNYTTAPGRGTTPLSTPYGASSPYISVTHTPASAIQPYNPQEWGRSSTAPGRERAQSGSAPDPHGGQGSPPPPPYSPPRSQRPSSGMFEAPYANPSAVREPVTTPHRPSPEPSSAMDFPPPPPVNAANRGVSRERRFGLPLGRRREISDSPGHSSPDFQPHVSVSRPPLQAPTPRNTQPLPIENRSQLPPNSRRSASTSAIDLPAPSSRSRSTPQSRWEPGMPLPPPPPGPPPSGSRSQSLNRTSPEPMRSQPTRRPPPSGVAALGPVPPTPANWVDETPTELTLEPESSSISSQLTQSIDAPITGESNSISSSRPTEPEQAPEEVPDPSPTETRLGRVHSVRGEKSIRERRNESRTRHGHSESITNVPSLSDIMVPQGTGLSRRLTVRRGTPRSGCRTGQSQDSPWSASRTGESSACSTLTSQQTDVTTPTPPFSPVGQKSAPQVQPMSNLNQPTVPRSSPTPPLESRPASSSSVMKTEIETSAPRSNVITAPVPCTPATKQAVITQTAEQFCTGTIERFRSFAQREATAATDGDRVKLFAEFMVEESRVRRERYKSAMGAMGSEVLDLTRDLFRPMSTRRDSCASNRSEWTPQHSEATHSHRNSIDSYEASTPASGSRPVTPSSGTPNNAYSSAYKPTLSPIQSMSISESTRDDNSRGRSASRWWESDSQGESASSADPRTVRESKYMGIPKEAHEALQWRDPPNSADSFSNTARRGLSDEHASTPGKVSWRDADQSTPQASRLSGVFLTPSAPNTPNPSHLDVSRLVTLPPPYPRHNPAVNNNHPELTEARVQVRGLSDMTEVQETKNRFVEESQNKKKAAEDEAAERRKAVRINLQSEISSGNVSYADAAAIEADSIEAEKAQVKELQKQEFSWFQSAVVTPANELLMARIAQATTLFEDLRAQHLVDTDSSNPNVPQEEGDEQPELLEKLTLLKWIFEAREMLHREIYDLLSERNDRYKNMVLIPYRQSGNAEKITHAEAFFANDAAKRRATFAAALLQRTQEFQAVISGYVERGVDTQLNAFWDIAPSLTGLLDKIPLGENRLRSFQIQVPASEIDENPTYQEHPLQYLFSLLLHAEKSTYQFIESQTNLLCLLHEVQEAVVSARAKVAEAEERDGSAERGVEQQKLADEVKEKVRVVQEQWNSALGDKMKAVKEVTGEWLLSTGGWDESLEDGGVGGV